ncbi:MAG: hypothetical protein MI725_02885 [Pirellulales bacterium]|nr:hypothetical protein [Pirellulales bacterium]
MDVLPLSLHTSASFLLADTPEITGTYVLQVALRVLHILSAIILVGGLFYIRTVLAPAGNEACYAGRREVWARWVGAASGLLLVSGFYNFMMILRAAKADETPLPRTYHLLFGVKFLLALLVMFLVAILAGKTEAAQRFRSQMGKWLSLSWLAAMAVVVIAAMLRTFH